MILKKSIGNKMYIIKHSRWNVRRHIRQIKKGIPQTRRNKFKNPCPSFMFEVPNKIWVGLLIGERGNSHFVIFFFSPIQQNRTSKRKCILTGTMEINSERKIYDIPQTIKKNLGGGEMLYSGSYHVTSGISEE